MDFFVDLCIINVKLDGTAEEALEKIHEKDCTWLFKGDKRKLFLIGVNFSAKTRNIERWIIEQKGMTREK